MAHKRVRSSHPEMPPQKGAKAPGPGTPSSGNTQGQGAPPPPSGPGADTHWPSLGSGSMAPDTQPPAPEDTGALEPIPGAMCVKCGTRAEMDHRLCDAWRVHRGFWLCHSCEPPYQDPTDLDPMGDDRWCPVHVTEVRESLAPAQTDPVPPVQRPQEPPAPQQTALVVATTRAPLSSQLRVLPPATSGPGFLPLSQELLDLGAPLVALRTAALQPACAPTWAGHCGGGCGRLLSNADEDFNNMQKVGKNWWCQQCVTAKKTEYITQYLTPETCARCHTVTLSCILWDGLGCLKSHSGNRYCPQNSAGYCQHTFNPFDPRAFNNSSTDHLGVRLTIPYDAMPPFYRPKKTKKS